MINIIENFEESYNNSKILQETFGWEEYSPYEWLADEVIGLTTYDNGLSRDIGEKLYKTIKAVLYRTQLEMLNEEEIINILEDMLEKAGKLYEEEFYKIVEDKQMWAVRGLLNFYYQEKEKNKKLENYKKMLNIEAKDRMKCIFEISEKLDIANKVIDLMADDYIKDYLYSERSDFPLEYLFDEIKKKDKCKQGEIGDCKECLKEYYFKVVKGEEYKNKYCGGED